MLELVLVIVLGQATSRGQVHEVENGKTPVAPVAAGLPHKAMVKTQTWRVHPSATPRSRTIRTQ